jgi:hypothetical protein
MNTKIQRNFEVLSPCDFIVRVTQYIPDKSFSSCPITDGIPTGCAANGSSRRMPDPYFPPATRPNPSFRGERHTTHLEMMGD